MEKAKSEKRSPSIQTVGTEDADNEINPTTTVADDAQPTAFEDDGRQCRRSLAADLDGDFLRFSQIFIDLETIFDYFQRLSPIFFEFQ